MSTGYVAAGRHARCIRHDALMARYAISIFAMAAGIPRRDDECDAAMPKHDRPCRYCAGDACRREWHAAITVIGVSISGSSRQATNGRFIKATSHISIDVIESTAKRLSAKMQHVPRREDADMQCQRRFPSLTFRRRHACHGRGCHHAASSRYIHDASRRYCATAPTPRFIFLWHGFAAD